MAFKVILTPLSGVGYDAGTLTTASAIARAFGGEVDAVFATPDVTHAIPTMGEGVSGLVVEQIMNAAEQELQQRRVRARAAFDAAGFAPTAWREHPGKEEAVVETLGRLADLIVLPNQAAAKDEIERAVTFERALIASGRPVLLAAAQPAAAPPGRVVMIAWNNSVQATRALAGAMPFCGAADRVLALTVASSKTRAGEADRLVRYLGRHGVKASALALEKSADVGATILECAEAEGVDLLVMGGYSRSRMAEMIFGGVTRHMVGRATMPILMAY